MIFDIPRGTPSISSREPLAVAIATGRKKAEGYGIIGKHRFYIVNARADGKGKDARRALHPAFAAFNADRAPANRDGTPGDQVAHDAKRATVRGNLVHASELECFWTNYKAQTLPGHQNPKMAPSCVGNGDRAKRWMPNLGEYLDIPCPGDRCEFQQPGPDKGRGPTRPPCGPYAILVFQLRFENAPCLIAKYESRGKESNGQLKGFFDDIRRQASMLGVHDPNFYGIPFVLDWTRRSNAEARTEWFVASMSTDFPPGMTLQQFLMRQLDERAQLVSRSPLMIGAAPTVIEAMSDDGHSGDIPRSE